MQKTIASSPVWTSCQYDLSRRKSKSVVTLAALTTFGAIDVKTTAAWSKKLHDDMLDAAILGRSITHTFIDEWRDDRKESNIMGDYAMKRLGHKHYAFFKADQSNWGGQRAVARYKCSHLEARRRFALLLIQRRLMS